MPLKVPRESGMKHNRPPARPARDGLALLTLEEGEGGAPEDERRLIEDCLKGESRPFGELVLRYQARLYSAVARVVVNTEDIQDVVQEAFLHAYQRLASFKGGSRFYTWLSRIALNAALTLCRKRKPVPRTARADGTALPEPADPSEAARPGHALEQAERGQAVRRALSRLSLGHRALLVLKDIEGMKYEQMADVLGVPIGTIRSRLHRARLELRGLLE